MNKDNMTVNEAFLLEAATLQKVRTVCSVERGLKKVVGLCPQATKRDVIQCYRQLEKDGYGKFLCGRKGKASRFVWNHGVAHDAYGFYYPEAA